MRAAFYAPLKPPDHPAPSGDRRIARLFRTLLQRMEIDAPLASRFRSREPKGDAARQARMAALGPALARRTVRHIGCPKPDFWFTYHLYYKAADWFGPEAAAALGVPYIVAEASYAPKRAGGPWDISHRRVAASVAAADAVLCLNPNDVACLAPIAGDQAKLIDFPPFLDTAPYRAAPAARQGARSDFAARLGLPADALWLLAVGMMRTGDKAASYQALARALEAFRPARDWRLIVVGDGPAAPEIKPALAAASGGRAVFAGVLEEAALARCYAAADLMVWPAEGEAFGMAMLEAQASGLPVVAGRTGGVPSVVEDGASGLLPPLGDARAFADAMTALAGDDARRQAFAAAARTRVEAHQSMDAARLRLEAVLAKVGVL